MACTGPLDKQDHAKSERTRIPAAANLFFRRPPFVAAFVAAERVAPDIQSEAACCGNARVIVGSLSYSCRVRAGVTAEGNKSRRKARFGVSAESAVIAGQKATGCSPVAAPSRRVTARNAAADAKGHARRGYAFQRACAPVRRSWGQR